MTAREKPEPMERAMATLKGRASVDKRTGAYKLDGKIVGWREVLAEAERVRAERAEEE